LPEYRIKRANARLVPCVLFAATIFGLGGCMSSPADQLASIKTNTPSKPTNLVELAAKQNGRDTTTSSIAQQAQADVDSLDSATADGVPVDQQGLTNQPRNIAATRNSIFSSQNNQLVNNGASQKTTRTGNAVDVTRSSLYAATDVEAVIAADSASRQSGADTGTLPSYENLAERMAVPTPKSDEVEKVQSVAMADTEIPILDTSAVVNSNALSPSGKTLTRDARSSEISALQAGITANALTNADRKATKKSFTLADLFRKSDRDFDGDRFPKKKKTVTRGIPNMQTAALGDDTLPGVNANAMFRTRSAADDDDHDDDEAEGLMRLASLPTMTRVAPNGLYVQTDKVEVGCLRPELVSVIRTVENHYKRPAIITSGFRDPRKNRRAGGVRHSLHTMCAAADIQIQGVSKWQLAEFLRSLPGRGGVGTYCHTESVHIDVGGERDWNWRCRRKSRMRG
jgi:uncharacterized protein YcbK (DUF882 family)